MRRLFPAVLAGLAATSAIGALTVKTSTIRTARAGPTFGNPVEPFHREHSIRARLREPRMVVHGPPTRRELFTGAGLALVSSGRRDRHPGRDRRIPGRVGDGDPRLASAGERGLGRPPHFAYWPIHTNAVLGRHGQVVNPLAPELGPFTDTTGPHERSIRILSADNNTLPSSDRCNIRIVALLVPATRRLPVRVDTDVARHTEGAGRSTTSS